MAALQSQIGYQPRRVDELKTDVLPKLTGKLYAGIKFSTDGTSCALAVACRTKDNTIFVEAIDCRPTRAGSGWLLDFYQKPTSPPWRWTVPAGSSFWPTP